MTRQQQIADHLSKIENKPVIDKIVSHIKNNKKKFAILIMRPSGKIKGVHVLDYHEDIDEELDNMMKKLPEKTYIFVVRYKTSAYKMFVKIEDVPEAF